MTDVSQRPIEQLHKVMEIWLTCLDLTNMERTLIEAFRNCQTHQEFEAVRVWLCINRFGELMSAIHKARQDGLLREWPSMEKV
jgi:hypothetical protein